MRFCIGLVRDLLFQCLTFAEMIQTDVRSDSVDPGVETRLEAKTSERSISFEEGLLENFPRLLAVSQHVKRETENVSIMPSDQLLESLAVAALSLFYEEFLILRFMNALCGPFQYGFHGYERFRRP